MKETVLIVGCGAREHAMAEALACSKHKPELLCFGTARNPGIYDLCTACEIGDVTNGARIASFASQHSATLAIIGPEAALAAGVADALWQQGIPVVGPTRSLARVESSKAFTRELLVKHGIAGNPFFQRFTSMQGVEELLERFPKNHVIKDDGLAGGKGVKVFGDHLHHLRDSIAYCQELVELDHAFVIEEKLKGEEFSLLSFCDGTTLRDMPLVQDHKRAHNGDTGPNTGGMGTYTDADHSLPFLSAADVAAASEINRGVASALEKECGAPYQGILYGGFMATRDGVRLIEYNARFGDPECLNLLTLIRTDFVEVCRAIVDRRLAGLEIRFANQASVCKYIVPEGYPESPRKGDVVLLPDLLPPEATIYLGAVDLRGQELVSTGSRTVAVVATADTIAEAESMSQSIVSEIPGPFYHRADIGTDALLQRRIDHMKELRTP